jgi:hypothetical protein
LALPTTGVVEPYGILVRSTFRNTGRSGESCQGIPSLSCAAASECRIEQAALEEQLRILGMKSKPISPEISQKLDQALAKAEETIKSTWARLDDAQRQGVENTILWGKKCMAFSREQLAKPRN